MATTVKSLLASATLGKPSIVELKPYLQPFPYGKLGMDSMAARFAKTVSPEIEIKEDQPYGEIWLGSTHKNGPSSLLSTGNAIADRTITLRDLIYSDPSFYLGDELLSNQGMQELYKQDLPFLFKILSFDKALPLQAHPDAKLGAKLKRRELLKQWYNSDFIDENGKPEVSVALSDFSAFIGFRPPRQIAHFARTVADFGELLSSTQIAQLDKAGRLPDDDESNESRDAIKSVFGTLIALGDTKARQCIQRISERLQQQQGHAAVFADDAEGKELARLWKLNVQTYGDSDPGVIITTFCMNLLQLRAGEGCWILADMIHAYAQGDVIECMANSDNMVAHGLGTDEQGGKKTFVDMLSYGHLPERKLHLDHTDSWPKGVHGRTRRYKIPIEEFEILSVRLDPQSCKEEMTLEGPHTLVVTRGTITARVGDETMTLPQGHTAFVRANAKLQLELVEGSEGEIWGSFYSKKDW